MRGRGPGRDPGLTPKAQAFVLAYLKHFNAQQAAIDAGYAVKNAKKQGYLLTKDPRVQAALAAFREERRQVAILSFEERARILSEIARGRLADFVKVSEPGLVALRVSEDQQNSVALSEMDTRTLSENQGGGRVTRIKLRDPVQAIRELNEMYGDHAPKRVDARVSGSIESMTDEQLKAEIDRLDEQTNRVASGRKKAGDLETGKN